MKAGTALFKNTPYSLIHNIRVSVALAVDPEITPALRPMFVNVERKTIIEPAGIVQSSPIPPHKQLQE